MVSIQVVNYGGRIACNKAYSGHELKMRRLLCVRPKVVALVFCYGMETVLVGKKIG